MGCTCSRPQAEEFLNAPPDIRARYSLDSVRHNADLAGDASIGVHVHTRQLAPAGASGHRSRSSSRSSSSLTRSQWKQMRALARSNTNPHFHQLQQLQLLPSHALNHQSQQEPATAAAALAAGLHSQQQHHTVHTHHLRHQQHVVHAAPSPRQASELPQHQGLSFSSLSGSHGHHSTHSSKDKAHNPKTKEFLSPEQVLALCGAVVQLDGLDAAAAGIQPLLLASICLIESGGCPKARQFRDHLGDVALGLCQMSLSTAQWLASTKGYDIYGSSPAASDLEDPKCCLYYCAAYLTVLSRHGGCQRNEGFLVKAYHAGPKGVDTDAASLYWQKYLKARHCLKEVARTMAVTVATAAATAGLPLEPPAACCSAEQDAVAVCNSSKPAAHSRSSSRCSSRCSISSTNEKENSSSKDAAAAPKDSSKAEQVVVWPAAAKLIGDLAGNWDGHAGSAAAAAGGKVSQDAADPAISSSSSSGSFIASILPSFWPASSSRSQQQQQGGSSSSTSHVRSSRRRHSDMTAAAMETSSCLGCMQLVPVAKAALTTALLRLCCIDYDSTCIAFSNAAAAAALYSKHSSKVPAEPGQFPTAAKGSGPWYYRRRNSSSNLNSSSTAATADDSCTLPSPCVMHVVGHGETLSQIASICGLAVPDILAANPDILEATAVQANDCIALPVPVVPPRLYVMQQGDSLHSIAKAHKTSLGRILARNPELRDPTSVQPGWVIVLPGLKGESKSGLALQWLAEAAAAEAESAAEQVSIVGDPHDDELHMSGVADIGSEFTHQRARRGSAPQARPHMTGHAHHTYVAHEQDELQQKDVSRGARDNSRPGHRGLGKCGRDAARRNSSDTGAVAVEVTRSSKDWSQAGWDVADHTEGHQTVSGVDTESLGGLSEGPRAPFPAVAVGTGLFMFTVGQSVA